jgi:hypothetical protein
MKNTIMKNPHQLHTYGWTTVTMEDLRKGNYYEGIFYGWQMHTHDIGNVYHDMETWNYPNKRIERKIEDNKQYKVWADYNDAADPMDSSCSYSIIYIEEA